MLIGDIYKHKTGNYLFQIARFDGLDTICLNLSDTSWKRIPKKELTQRYEFLSHEDHVFIENVFMQNRK